MFSSFFVCNNCNKTLDDKRDKIISCLYCRKNYCRDCYIKYLISTKEYNCPNCKVSIDKQLIYNLLSFNSFNTLQKNFIEKHKFRKCLNCKNGTLYHLNSQVICDKCNSIFCFYTAKQIYPEKIETFDLEHLKIKIIDNPLYSFYTEEQKINTLKHYKYFYYIPHI